MVHFKIKDAIPCEERKARNLHEDLFLYELTYVTFFEEGTTPNTTTYYTDKEGVCLYRDALLNMFYDRV